MKALTLQEWTYACGFCNRDFEVTRRVPIWKGWLDKPHFCPFCGKDGRSLTADDLRANGYEESTDGDR